MAFTFEITSRDKKTRARVGVIRTAHGEVKTPYLVPVATRGNIIALSDEDVKMLNMQCLLANTYHLHLKPGDLEIKKMGGLHKYMKFDKPIFTDSGGFQAFSLGLGREVNARKIGFFPEDFEAPKEKSEKLALIKENGVEFTSVYDGSKQFMGPKESMEIQSNLRADIIMAFDECTSAFSSKEYIEESMHRSHKWEIESLKYHDKAQAIYGIIHGGWFKDLRLKSAKFINALGFDGIAIGGSLGKTKEDMYEVLDWIIPVLDERPRHMLGIGRVEDIFECVERGIDTFDCVESTRIARHGLLYISPDTGGSSENKFRINIKKSKYKEDGSSIDKNCDCFTCKNYSCAQLHALAKAKNHEYGRLASIHNISFMQNLCSEVRKAIENNRFLELKFLWLKDK